jgi:segregation and condensation protein B
MAVDTRVANTAHHCSTTMPPPSHEGTARIAPGREESTGGCTFDASEVVPGDTSSSREPSRSEAMALAPRVEALLMTAGRAVTAGRLAVALRLVAPDLGTNGDVSVEALRAAEDAAGVPVRVRRGRRQGQDRAARSPADLIGEAVDLLNDQYERSGRSFRIERVSGGYRVMTLSPFREDVARLLGLGATARLSRPAIEALAIIAYRQPMTRAQLEAIRGVACGEVLKTLLDRRLVVIAGRAEELGRPLLYATSRQFLEAFGLASLKDLPKAEDLGR